MGADCFSPGHVSAPRLGVAVAEIAAALSRLAETPEPDVIRTRIKAILVNAPRHAVDQMPNRLAVPDDNDALLTRTPTAHRRFVPAGTRCARRRTRRCPGRPVRPIASRWRWTASTGLLSAIRNSFPRYFLWSSSTRVELVCVDELHNLNLATRAGAEVVRPAEVLRRTAAGHIRLCRHRCGGWSRSNSRPLLAMTAIYPADRHPTLSLKPWISDFVASRG